jgi:hypothetical protein
MAMMQTPQFGGFQPSGKAKIAQAMGFQGPMEQFDQFLQDNPDKQSEMMKYEDIAKKMVSGGYVRKMQDGGMTLAPQVIVYGPDGKQYSNPMAAQEAGVANYSYSLPNNVGTAGPPSQNTTATTTAPPQNTDEQPQPPQTMGGVATNLMNNPTLPVGTAVQPVGTVVSPEQIVSTTSGQVDPRDTVSTSTAQTAQAQTPQQTQTNTMQASTVADDVNTAL